MRCINPRLIWPHRSMDWLEANPGGEVCMQVPCGKCLACLSNKRAEWIFRLEQEFKYSKSSLFVTLTYDEKHLRTDKSLCKRDLQNFIKRLRKRYAAGTVRYYGVGEYGEVSGRPHYHLLLFNVMENDVRASWCDSRGQKIGLVHIGNVSQASIAYCTKYIVQRPTIVAVESMDSTFTLDELEPKEKPFAVMSRSYGIGGRYLSDEMVQWHRDNEAAYVRNHGFVGRLPRLFKSKIWYSESERELIGRKAMLRALIEERRKENYFEKKWGAKWKSKYLEMRDAMLAGIKEKVAYTQTL